MHVNHEVEAIQPHPGQFFYSKEKRRVEAMVFRDSGKRTDIAELVV
jgi:hypothetical protein